MPDEPIDPVSPSVGREVTTVRTITSKITLAPGANTANSANGLTCLLPATGTIIGPPKTTGFPPDVVENVHIQEEVTISFTITHPGLPHIGHELPHEAAPE